MLRKARAPGIGSPVGAAVGGLWATSGAFSHGSLQRRREMQYIEGNSAPFLLLQRTQHARMHPGGRFWPVHPGAGGHFATTVTCGDISDSIWGSPVPPKPAGSAEPGSASYPRHAAGRRGENRVGFLFFFSPLHNCYYFFFVCVWSRKAVSFSASPPSACCGRRRQIPAAVGPGSCSASRTGPNARVLFSKRSKMALQAKHDSASLELELGASNPAERLWGRYWLQMVCLSVCLGLQQG